jgi:hypothetical protein
MTTTDLISKEVQQLPETLAAEVLDFVRFLRMRQEGQTSGVKLDQALQLLDHPPLDLGGKYFSRDQCHDRADLR